MKKHKLRYDYSIDSHKHGTSELLEAKTVADATEPKVLELKRAQEASDRGVIARIVDDIEDDCKEAVSVTLDIVNDLYWCNNA